jgi:hypothetical protein
MANPYNVNLLGGFNVGQALGQLGQQFGQMRREDEAMQQQQQMQDLMAQAASGDTNAINQLMAINPQAGMAFEQRLQGQQGAEQEAMKQRTTDALERLYFAPEHKRYEMFEQMVNDPTLDIDQEDVDVVGNQQAFQAALGELKGKDWATTAFGGQQTAPKYTNIKTTASGELMGLNEATSQYEMIQAPAKVREATPQVQVGSGEKEEEKAIGKARGQAFAGIQEQARGANKTLSTLNSLDKLSEKAFSGALVDAKVGLGKIATAFGVDVEGLPESEAFTALANSLTLDKAGQLSGALSDKDIAFLQNSVPQLSQTPEGRKKLIKIMRDVANIEKQLAKDASQYKNEKGSFDQVGFEDWVKTKRGDQDMLSKYFEGQFTPGSEAEIMAKYGVNP